jgi:hypothetical protein
MALTKGRRRLAAIWLVATASLVAVTEVACRLVLGLGDPPLSISDPEIEYLFKPSSTYHRFGHLVRYNAFSMRSEDFPARKADPSELRVLVIGDSVVNGGVQTDQSELATSLLQAGLARRFERTVHVGNISAGSWGPPNQLAYMKRFGWFDADVTVLVFSSHDSADAPTFEPVVGVSPDFPDRKPLLAMTEAVMRYLPRYLPREATAAPPPPPTEADLRWCLDSVCELVRSGRAAGSEVFVALYLDRMEASTGRLEAGHDLLAARAEACGAKVVELGPLFQEALRRGEDPYRDSIHPNARGQRLIVQAIEPLVVPAISERLRLRPPAR